MKVSILLPSRKRAKLAQDSIKSLGTHDLEIILAVDADDPELDQYKEIEGVVLQVGMRYGYKQLHEYYNKMAKVAQGDWLMVWNDDALMQTENWTDLINENPNTPLCLNIYNPSNDQDNLFPLISRKWYDTVKHYSLSPHNDSWVQDIANELGIHKAINGIKIVHIRHMLMDETKYETQSAYSETSPLHYSPEMQSLLRQDLNLLKEQL